MKIAIIGLGWLGQPLAKKLITEQYSVIGTTTSQDKIAPLTKEGITTQLLKVTPEQLEGNLEQLFYNVNTVVLNIPPGLRKAETVTNSFVKKIEILKQAFEQYAIENVIFVSSTSVYGDATGNITEDTIAKPVTNSGKQLLVAEELLKSAHFKTTIIRFGGLIGKNRHPIIQLSGKKTNSNPFENINCIHQNDAIQLIITCIALSFWGETINGVAPTHPTKEDFYTVSAKKRAIEPPIFTYEPFSKQRSVRIITSKHEKLLSNISFNISLTE